jgi:hypothetical protein
MTAAEKGMLDDYWLLGARDPQERQSRCAVGEEDCCPVTTGRRTMISTSFFPGAFEGIRDGSVGGK